MSITVLNFKRKRGISLEMLQWERASSCNDREPRGISSCGGILELQRGMQGAYRVAPENPIPIRVVRGSWGLLSNHCRENRPHLGLCPETPCSSPVATGISVLHSRFTWRVRPRLELKQTTPLSSRVATGISWSPLSGINRVKPPVEF